jgi:hypothetical protein
LGPITQTRAYHIAVKSMSNHLPGRCPRSRAVFAVGLGAAAVFATAVTTVARSDYPLASNSRQACAWRTIPSSDPHPSLYDRFDSIAAVSPRDAWAVGDYFTGREGGRQGAFIERWNGRRWRLAAAPIPRGAILWSLSASGARDVWAVGQADDGGQLIEHWDGARWRVAPAPRHGGLLNGVVALTSHNAWAVGAHFGARGKTLIEHWDGARWMVVPSPSPPAAPSRRPHAILSAVTAISPSDVWAAGYSVVGVPATTLRTLIEHWDGRHWTIVPSPNVRSPRGVTNDILFSISGSRRDDVWAVGSWGSVPGGYGGKGDHALALHWDGRSWSRIATPAVAQRSLLLGVVTRGGRAWSVGDRGLQPHQQTLIERWDGARWSVVPSPAGFSLAAVTTSSGGAVWTVGANGRRPLAARC